MALIIKKMYSETLHTTENEQARVTVLINEISYLIFFTGNLFIMLRLHDKAPKYFWPPCFLRINETCFNVMGLHTVVDTCTRIFTGPCTNLIDEVFTLITKNVAGSPPRVTREQINKIINSFRQVILSRVSARG